VLQCVAVCCSVLQCVAVCCSVLKRVATCCIVLQCHFETQVTSVKKLYTSARLLTCLHDSKLVQYI